MSELFPESHTGGGGDHAHGGKKGGKILGMPPWLLGASAAGLILLFIIIRRKAAGGGNAAPATGSATSGAAPLAYDDPNQVDPNSATGETYAQEGYTTPTAVDSYLAGSGSPQAGPVGLSPQGLPPPSTNTQWGSLVADYLIGQGDDPTLVTNAINAFTQGQTLTQAQQAIINVALQTFGEPPQGVIPISTTNTNATTPPPSTTPPTTVNNPPAQPGPNPRGKSLTEALSESNIVNVSYAYKDVPSAQWNQYGAHTIASATATGDGWRVGLN